MRRVYGWSATAGWLEMPPEDRGGPTRQTAENHPAAEADQKSRTVPPHRTAQQGCGRSEAEAAGFSLSADSRSRFEFLSHIARGAIQFGPYQSARCPQP